MFGVKYKQYTKEEEVELCKKMREGDLEARDRLFESCIPWTINVAKRIAGNRYGNPIDESKLDDIVQAGLFGLLECLKRFDPEKSRLTTYSSWWVRKECLAWLWKDRTIYLPRYLSGKDFRGIGIPSVYYLDLHHNNGRDTIPIELSLNHKDFEEVDNADEIDLLMKKSIDVLTETEKEILFLRSRGKTLRQIGVTHGICKERVRQLQNKAVERLRNLLKLNERKE